MNDVITDISKYYRVSRIKPVNFRNFPEYELQLGRIVALVGENGIGKSNMLEAISLLYPGHGLKAARANDMIKFGGNYWSITATVNDGTYSKRLDVSYDGNIKSVKINFNPIERINELANNISVIWCTPDIISDFSATNQARRAFFDRVTYSFHHCHANHCNNYNKLLSERSRLLRSGSRDEKWLNVLEQSIADFMLKILHARHEVLSAIKDFIPAGLEIKAAGSAETLYARDNPKEVILNNLRDSRSVDTMRGGLSFGTHRTKFILSKSSIDFDLCSTGEKKSMILDILLAQARLKIYRHKIYPVLLLDDVLDQLSGKYRAKYMEIIRHLECQVIMTADENQFPEYVEVMPIK